MARFILYALFIPCLLALSFNSITLGQEQDIHSKIQLQNVITSEDSIFACIDLLERYKYADPKQAVAFGKKGLKIATEVHDRLLTARLNSMLGQVYFEMGLYSQALKYYSSALNRCIDDENYLLIGNCLNNIGKVYHKLDIYSLALKSFEHAIKSFKRQNLTSRLAETYNNSGRSYCKMKEYDVAMQFFNDVLDLPGDSISQEMRAQTYLNISNLFLNRGDLELAREFNSRAMGIFERIVDSAGSARAHINLGDINRQGGDYISTLQEYTEASYIYEQLLYQRTFAESILLLAEVHIDLGEYTTAIQLTNQAMAIGHEHQFLEVIEKSYYLLSNLYGLQDDIHAAHEYFLQYNLTRDSINNQELTNAIARTEIQTAFIQYEFNFDQIEGQRIMERNTRWFIIIFCLLLLVTVILALSRVFSQRKANKILAHQRNVLKKSLMDQRISELKYKQLFSQANDSIFLMDRETFTDCNDKTLEMFACAREDIIGHSPYKFSPEFQPDGNSSKEKAIKLIKLCYKGQPQRFYWLHSKKDGTTFDAEVSLNVITLEGENYLQAIVRDISERVRAEKEMVQARDSAEKATQSKTFFLAKMSHDIRTMLGGITSSSQLLKETKVDKNQKELLDIINNSADNLLSIVNEILDLSKIEAGKIDLESRSFNLRKIFENTVNAYLQRAKEKNISLYLSIHPRIPQFTIGDELRIKQILANLLSNAIKFTEKGSVTCDVVVVKEYTESFLIGMKISDTGIGIPQNRIKDMFNEYTQSEVSVSRQYGGTGLGLNIVYKLVNLMQGTIEVSSELKKGTQFTINLPLQKADQKSHTEAVNDRLEAKVFRKYNILLAEDNLVNQRITIINLQNLGYRVDLAEDGYQTWEKYLKKKYDVILMDIQMPEMDGIEVTRMIRKHEKEHPSKKRTRIVAITANILGQDAEYCLSAGMDAYIAKPFKVEDIIENIDEPK